MLAGAVYGADFVVGENNWYSYYFEFSDGAETVTTPLDSIYVEVTAFVCGDVDGNGSGPDIADLVYLNTSQLHVQRWTGSG